MQRCIEERSFAIYDERGNQLRAAIDRMAAFDISFVPAERRGALTNSYKQARMTFARVAEVRKTEAALKVYIPKYEPTHRLVRKVQLQIREIDVDRDKLKQKIRRLSDTGGSAQTIRELRARQAALSAEKTRLEGRIPKVWKGARKQFLVLAKAERLADRKSVV